MQYTVTLTYWSGFSSTRTVKAPNNTTAKWIVLRDIKDANRRIRTITAKRQK